MLNVSEAGLSFSTFAPVPQSGPVHFWFSLDLRDRIEAWGEVAWRDAAKKTGGLRFIRLSEKARRQIREWICRLASQEASDDGLLGRAEGTGAPTAGIETSEPDAVARFVSKARPRQATFLSSTDGAGHSSTLFPTLREVEANAAFVPLQRYLSAKRQQLILGLLLGAGISAAAAISAVKYSDHRHENRDMAKARTELPTQKSGETALPPLAKSPSAASGTSADIFSIGKQKKGVAQDHTPSNQAAATVVHPSPRALEPPASNPSARTLHQPDLNGNGSQQKTSMTPEQLWASVQAGNSKAAVALADRYLKGEGVPQNCSQARVLLQVASQKRNAGAIKKLQELDKDGCPAN